MSVELIRFWKSLLLRRSSSSLILSSWLTVLSSSLTDCSSSLLGLQLLGGRSQLLVGRLLLFARRLGFLYLRFVLLDRRPQVRLDAGELLFELLGDRPGRRVQGPHAAVGRVAAVVIREEHEEEAARRVVVAQLRADDDVDAPGSAFELHRHVPDLDADSLRRALVEGGADVGAQVRAKQADQIAGRFAGRHLQVLADARRHVDDGVVVGHDQRGRRVLLEQPVVDVERREALRPGAGLPRAAAAAGSCREAPAGPAGC